MNAPVNLAPSSNIVPLSSKSFHLFLPLAVAIIIIDNDIARNCLHVLPRLDLSITKNSYLHHQERCLAGFYSSGRSVR